VCAGVESAASFKYRCFAGTEDSGRVKKEFEAGIFGAVKDGV